MYKKKIKRDILSEFFFLLYVFDVRGLVHKPPDVHFEFVIPETLRCMTCFPHINKLVFKQIRVICPGGGGTFQGTGVRFVTTYD